MKTSNVSRVAWFAAAALVWGLGDADEAFGQKKNDKAAGNGHPATPADYAVIRNSKEIVGKFQGLDPQGNVTLRIEYTEKSVQKGAAPKGKKGRPNAQVTTKKAYVDFDLALQKGAPLRKLNLPFEFDMTGNPKQYSASEKAALRGKDPSLPGYVAQPDEIRTGATVKLFLVTPKNAAAPKKDEALSPDQKPTVRMLVMLAEPEGGTKAPKKK